MTGSTVFKRQHILGRKNIYIPGINLEVRIGWNYTTKICTYKLKGEEMNPERQVGVMIDGPGIPR